MNVISDVFGKGVVVPGDDIDTDRIIPARFLKEITFENMGKYLFADARFNSDGSPKSHPLNDARFLGASIMIVGRNFGCGSSREHAPQAIKRFGINAIVGESYAEIFWGNCRSLGVPAVTVSPEDRALIEQRVVADPQQTLHVDLRLLQLSGSGWQVKIHLPETFRNVFLEGSWDALGMLKANADLTAKTEQRLPYAHEFQA
ncbi:MAG: 3-isopropylmalate dehydratase small subunit [Candidatus Margulisiibacteriota bacterium]